MNTYDFSDLQSLENANSVERTFFLRNGVISLSDYPNSPLFDYSNYEMDRFRLSSDGKNEATFEEKKLKLKGIFKRLNVAYPIINDSKLGQNIRICVNEMLRNAQKHGNKLNPKKKIGVGFKLENNDLYFFVEDSGGVVDANFFEYRRYVRESLENLSTGDFIPIKNFYEFSYDSDFPAYPNGHSGQGTRLVHSLADSVGYYKSELGGLLVLMGYNLSKY